MSNSILTRNEKDAISGFYYDQQLRQPSMIMSLHPNMRPTGKTIDDLWQPVSDAIDNKFCASQDGSNPGYSATPIAVAIINEDFQIGVANQFDDNSILDDASQLFNSVKPLAAYGDFITEQLGKAQDGGHGYLNRTGGSSLTKGLEKMLDVFSGAAKKYLPYLNRALVVQGSRFSSYNGSGVAFGNLSMKFTLFSDWTSEIIGTNDEDGFYKYGGWVWKDCIKKVQDLTPYCVGKFAAADFNIGSEDNSKILNQFIGWQIPPGGYKPDLKNLDNVQTGTLMVIFGGMYCIKNLVISDAQFNFSKQRIKVPKSTSGEMIDTVPMYCDVQLTLKPASKYSDVSFNSAIGGEEINVVKTTINNNYNKRLNDLMR